jgi:hypothetical protein
MLKLFFPLSLATITGIVRCSNFLTSLYISKFICRACYIFLPFVFVSVCVSFHSPLPSNKSSVNCLSVSSYICVSVAWLSKCLSICLSFCLPICLYFCLSVCPHAFSMPLLCCFKICT